MNETNKWLSLIIVLVAPLLSVIDVYIVNMALPEIKQQYVTSDSNTELVISSYLLGYCVFLVTGGRAGDFFGRKKIFIIGTLSFTITSALCGCAVTILQLILFRFFQGVAAAFMIPQTLTIIQVTFREAKERNTAFGFFGITLGIASILGQFLGGYFVAHHYIEESWRLIFLINVPFGLVTVVLSFFFLQETSLHKGGKFDMLGVLLLTIALGSLIYGLTLVPEQGLSVLVLLLPFLSGIFLYIFWKNQKRKTQQQSSPLMNTNLFKIKSFNLVLLVALFFFGAHNSYLLICAVQFQKTLHLDPYVASQYFTFNGIGFLMSSFIALKLLHKYGIKLLIIGCFLMIISLVLQVFTLGDPANVDYIPCFLLLYGLGQGILLPSILNYALKKIPADYAALAGGVYSTVQQFSSAFGISIIGSVFFYSLKQHLDGYSIAMSMAIVYLVFVALFLYRLSKLNTTNPS
ncbi:MFS transporter [Flavobacterium gawalongense]|uniref:MFS transporter n=1 Tax=Flavobacterium gawalongense TaxID=2594432 RepID=A0A553BSM3_9FLAO|nr:MFS transporter [Flavobacterium gawalongense]TRX11239.1 MFS transporter [Flavobacterium gawalongense]TRX12300.1 MFS transporter [Flavobacterium gawalongense]TRX30161.1 MFS transporter [Flavobacterium gawalongense]